MSSTVGTKMSQVATGARIPEEGGSREFDVRRNHLERRWLSSAASLHNVLRPSSLTASVAH